MADISWQAKSTANAARVQSEYQASKDARVVKYSTEFGFQEPDMETVLKNAETEIPHFAYMVQDLFTNSPPATKADVAVSHLGFGIGFVVATVGLPFAVGHELWERAKDRFQK